MILGTARKLLLLSNDGVAPIVEQDTGSQTTGGATSDTATFALATVTGRGIIVVLALKGARQVSTITDNKSNTYVRVGRAADSTDCSVEMWYCQPITGGSSHTITVTFDGATYCVWGALEASRVKGGGAFLDTRTVNTATRGGSGSSAAPTVTSGLPRSANELFVAMVGIAGGGSNAGIATPTNWNSLTLFQDHDSIMAGHGDHRINVNANTVSATWPNNTTTSPYAAIIAGFRGENAISGGTSPPVNTVAPAITGTTTVTETLTCSTGTWSGSPTSYTYQWKDDGVAISGAVASTYVLTASEVGATITCTVTAYNDGGSASATATGVGPILAANADILDAASVSPTGAWSPFRRLRSAYSSNLIKVRRSSDSTEQDIGVTASGLLDTSALLTFVGAGDGFIRTLYDQSGNSRHMQQSTTANQPKIVSSGALVATISLACMQFDGTDDGLATTGVAHTTILPRAAYTLIGSIRPTAGGSNADGAAYNNPGVFGVAPIATGFWQISINSSVPSVQFYDFAAVHRTTALTSDAVPYTAVIAERYNSTTKEGWINGGTGFNTALSQRNTHAGELSMAIGYSTTEFTGYIAELVTYGSALSNADLNIVGDALADAVSVTWSTAS